MDSRSPARRLRAQVQVLLHAAVASGACSALEAGRMLQDINLVCLPNAGKPRRTRSKRHAVSL